MPWTRGKIYSLYAQMVMGEIYHRGGGYSKIPLTKAQRKRRIKGINGRKAKRKNK